MLKAGILTNLSKSLTREDKMQENRMTGGERMRGRVGRISSQLISIDDVVILSQ